MPRQLPLFRTPQPAKRSRAANAPASPVVGPVGAGVGGSTLPADVARLVRVLGIYRLARGYGKLGSGFYRLHCNAVACDIGTLSGAAIGPKFALQADCNLG